MAPIEVVKLGEILRLDVIPTKGGEYSMQWTRKKSQPLAWCASGQCLVFPEMPPAKKTQSTKASDLQIKLYRMWHDQEPSDAVVLSYPIDARRWKKVGEVTRIDYHSTKWGDDEEYMHESSGGSYLYLCGEPKRGVYAIHGKMRATAEGLVK